MKTNLTLIGFMGVGKTTIGRILAKKLDMNFVDIDKLIETHESSSIADIFKNKGEQYFRELEKTITVELEHVTNTVISTGGGIVTNSENIISLKKHSNICLIESEINLIYHRCLRKKAKRPLLNTENAFEKISYLLDSRHDLYENSCDFKVVNANEGLEILAERIKNIYIDCM